MVAGREGGVRFLLCREVVLKKFGKKKIARTAEFFLTAMPLQGLLPWHNADEAMK